MARKSRKELFSGTVASGIVADTRSRFNPPKYRTGIYARLSIEDNRGAGDSIENQIHIVEEYIRQNEDLLLVQTFIDNGQTGTDFQRPGFQALMEAIKNKEVDCIAVKDLSRFGRNYLETGEYLERVFPLHHVRFISVNDRFDTLYQKWSDGLMIPLTSILHDQYARDISRKICGALEVRKGSGRFMGKMPPYGYIRDPEDRCHLLVHPERAQIVQQVFQKRLEGNGPVIIARELNRRKVPTQMNLRYQEGHRDGKKDSAWSGSTITEMLKNPVYLGCIVERKSSCPLYQGRKKILIPREQWKLIPHTHEPIIDRDIFEQVQKS